MSVYEDTNYFRRPLEECVATLAFPQGDTEAVLEVITVASALGNPATRQAARSLVKGLDSLST
eukprot:8538698-Pyramimonas_sp.AAC.1